VKWDLNVKTTKTGLELVRDLRTRKSGKRLATGTDVEFIPDPESCKVRISGTINDDDREAVENQARDLETKCRKGY